MKSQRQKSGSRRLADLLRALPEQELAGLVSRRKIRIDKAKRLDAAAQAARVLVGSPELHDPSRLPAPSVELMRRVAESGGSLLVESLPSALEPLLARGLMFARAVGEAIELVLPHAYVVELRTWEGEDPRGIRALLAQASLEALSAVAAHYRGKPPTPPIALSLEAAWEVLGDRIALEAQLADLPPSERRVLDAIEREGGEVDTEELLELEREPLRLRTASGATPSRRGVGIALERRGFLVPVHPNRHVIPTEVAQIIGARRIAERARKRESARSFVVGTDHAPRRARFAPNPAHLAVGLALSARESGQETRPNVGTPKSLIQKLAARIGVPVEQAAIVIALSRAIGLWETASINASSPPGSLRVSELPHALFRTWRRGGAWDEARAEPETLRLPPDARESSPIGAVREIVLDALTELGDTGWVPYSALKRYVASDDRIAATSRLLRRWAERTSSDSVEAVGIAGRMVFESLHALGIVDVGTDALGEGDANASTDAMVRLTPRGRGLLLDRKISSDETPAKFLDTQVLRIGGATRLAHVFALGALAEVARASEHLDLLIAPQTIARALSAGYEADSVRQRIEAVAPMPSTLSKTIAQASAVLGRASFVGASGFLWIEDSEIRELLRSRRTTVDLFVDPSPPAGLLIAHTVDLDRLARRCRAIGVEIVHEGEVVRAKSIPPRRHTPRSTKKQG